MLPKIKTVGIVGHGPFGKFIETLVRRFVPEAEVFVYTRSATVDNEHYHTLQTVAACDVVFVTVAIRAYEAVLAELAPLLRPETMVVDVATVKTHTLALIQKLLPQQPFISCHPMFGPESYEKCKGSVSGFRIVVCEHALPDESARALTNFFTDAGFVLIEMSADEHDQMLAKTLFLTHYIAQTMKEAELGRTTIDTVSFGSLMNAVESVQNDDQLFADVYRFNPYCADIAKRFHTAQDEVFARVSGENEKTAL